MSPRRMGEFVVDIAAKLGLGQPHAVGPDIGTGALLFAAATHPRAFRSLMAGAGAGTATFPLHVDGVLKAFIDAASIEDFRGADPGAIIRGAISSIRNYDVRMQCVTTTSSATPASGSLTPSPTSGTYPTDLADLAPLLAGISTPVQIIVGRDDPYGLAADGKLLYEQLPRFSRSSTCRASARPGEVRIRVQAVAVNPTDMTLRTGGRAAQLANRPPPYVPGMDVAGTIDKLGDGTAGRLAVGDSVIAYVIPMGPHGGTYAEQIVVGEASVVHAPRGVAFPEAEAQPEISQPAPSPSTRSLLQQRPGQAQQAAARRATGRR